MYTASLQEHAITSLAPFAPQQNTTGDLSLEQAVGISLLGDYDQELENVSLNMKSQLAQKQNLRRDIATLHGIGQREANQNGYVELSIAETQAWGWQHLALPHYNDKQEVTGFMMQKDKLGEDIKSKIAAKEEKLTDLNSSNELLMLEIQSLVDQRKNALILLSNLMASKNKTLGNIIANIRD